MNKSEKSIAIVQSNYLPWKGYFDLISSVNEFILYDDAQYTKRDWRNRNLINTPNGPQWLSVPVQVKGKFEQSINATMIEGENWSSKHWKTIIQNYKKAPYFYEISNLLSPIYNDMSFIYLSDLNKFLIITICNYLGIETVIKSSSEFTFDGNKSEKLLNIARETSASSYFSGPSAMGYLDTQLFSSNNIEVVWFTYDEYPIYNQLWPGEFLHQVSIIDVLFCCGPQSFKYIKPKE